MKRNSKSKQPQQEQDSRWKIRVYEPADETELTEDQDEQFITLIEQENPDAEDKDKSAGAAFC